VVSTTRSADCDEWLCGDTPLSAAPAPAPIPPSCSLPPAGPAMRMRPYSTLKTCTEPFELAAASECELSQQQRSSTRLPKSAS